MFKGNEMKLLTGYVDNIRVLREQTLDELWLDASSLGGIRIYQYQAGREYKATIVWERKSGSEISAVGTGSDVGIALSNAIIEARELGAGLSD